MFIDHLEIIIAVWIFVYWVVPIWMLPPHVKGSGPTQRPSLSGAICGPRSFHSIASLTFIMALRWGSPMPYVGSLGHVGLFYIILLLLLIALSTRRANVKSANVNAAKAPISWTPLVGRQLKLDTESWDDEYPPWKLVKFSVHLSFITTSNKVESLKA